MVKPKLLARVAVQIIRICLFSSLISNHLVGVMREDIDRAYSLKSLPVYPITSLTSSTHPIDYQ